MKSLMTAALAAALFAGCATAPAPKKDALDIRPEASKDGVPTLVAWQDANRAAIDAATAKEVLSAFVASPAAADALLAKVEGAYRTDPLTMTQIAAVTQLVMCPKCPKAPACRAVWSAALVRAAAGTKDGYVRTFLNQQLDLCK